MTTLTPGEVGAALEAALAEEPRIAAASAYVFGSVAEGRAHRQSDVDVALLLVRAAHPSASDRFDARLRLSARLADRLGRTVDVVILNDAAPGLGRHVVTRGSRVLCRDADADHAFVRDVQLRAADLRPLRANLGSSSPAEHLARLLIHDGEIPKGSRRCASPGAAAFTSGGAAVFVCGTNFQTRGRTFRENALIHEMLHTLGLRENPPGGDSPSSAEISRRVAERCGS